MEASKRNEMVLRFLKISNQAVLILFFLSGFILLALDHRMGEVFLYGALLMMASTPLVRSCLLVWLYTQEKRKALAWISLTTILLIFLSSVASFF